MCDATDLEQPQRCLLLARYELVHGILNRVRRRDAIIASFAAFALAASSAATMPSAFFWFGQITNHTFAAMMIASHMPMPIIRVVGSVSIMALCRWP